MRDKIHTIRQKAQSVRENVPSWVVVLSIGLLLLTSTAAGQVTVTDTWEDDFEDGDIQGWGEPDSDISISNQSVNGSYSLFANSQGDTSLNSTYKWNEGPRLDLRDGFTIRGTVRPEFPDGGGAAIRVGIFSENQGNAGENALLIFDGDGDTFLATYTTQSGASDELNTNFAGEWVNFEMTSDSGSNTVQAKVWEYNSSEPDTYQLNQTFDPLAGEFGVNTGYDSISPTRELYVDDVWIRGSEYFPPDLRLESEPYMRHGSQQPYNVYLDTNATVIANRTQNVTDEANVTSSNSSLVVVNNQTNRLYATSVENRSGVANVTAAYNSSTDTQEVVVANATVANLDILPPMQRISATFGSSTIQAILVALFMGVFGARVSTSFGGLALMQLVMVASWFSGYATVGITMISLFTALFVGLNMAANIDYTVRR